ncbi:PREDICTED: protein FAM32A-like [Prunus mume]|uniref:Protein FAM32A-like n=1 Tax=Prunus mume TaxID=102107 RepID=A0ABM0N5M6_PRUMU|nr:PREDICTED: protein FAM32A-like [Prunus mume]
MSAFDNVVVVGKLKLKGKPLAVKGGGVSKKNKKKRSNYYHQLSQASQGGEAVMMDDTENDGGRGQAGAYDDHLTPAERRYLQQTERIQLQKLAKMAKKSHRDRVQEFNHCLANLSEHYDIPKVGPANNIPFLLFCQFEILELHFDCLDLKKPFCVTTFFLEKIVYFSFVCCNTSHLFWIKQIFMF